MSYRVILESDSPIRLLGVSPTPPPADPVPVPIPSVSPVDNTPFTFPTDCPRYPYDADAGDRNYKLTDIGGENGYFYAAEVAAGNPSERSHTCAGFIQAGPYAGLRLWVPIRAGLSHPDLIRKVRRDGVA